VSNDLNQREVPSSDLAMIDDDDTDKDETILQGLRNSARETKAAENASFSSLLLSHSD
jgi:hypothetical protein